MRVANETLAIFVIVAVMVLMTMIFGWLYIALTLGFAIGWVVCMWWCSRDE